jgi:(1->4)-alpha-D-glucan 1-alpha-D-glucosylmutase
MPSDVQDLPAQVTPEIAPPDIQSERTADLILSRLDETRLSARPPIATYRLQFHAGFTFRDATRIVSYLRDLGISHVYASPYFKATPGSTHGYDIIDYSQLNPELGTEADFREFMEALKSHEMSHILDFVPNHMGVGTDANPWWQDVLENGPSSQYSTFFDIEWNPLKTDLEQKVLLPVLGDQYGKVLEEQQLKLEFDGGAFHLRYWERTFPIAPRSYALILQHRIAELEASLGADNPHLQEYQSILTAIRHLPPRTETVPERIQERYREKEVMKRRLQRLSEDSQEIRTFIDANVEAFNGRKGEGNSFVQLDALLMEQAYRLCYWKVAADEINYRRFFDVNGLAAICMERPEVFEQSHAFVFRLLDEGLVDGLRIDHADGLYAPTEYLRQLQKRRSLQLARRQHESLRRNDVSLSDWEAARPLVEQRLDERARSGNGAQQPRPMYLVVEKILEGPESLPADWPVHGTSGYEFLSQVNGIFVRTDEVKEFDDIETKFVRQPRSFEEIVYHSKRLILRASMASELSVLGHLLDRISEQNWRSRDFTRNGLTYALREIVACFPVYRTYTTDAGVLDRDRRYIDQAVRRAIRRNPAIGRAEFEFIRDLLLLNLPTAGAGSPSNEASAPPHATYDRALVMQFIGRFQQLTGPVMAKSVEDTAFYRFHRLISLNEVGGDPLHFGGTLEEFHRFNSRRVIHYPHGMSATGTHDTKRGEDTRARINVLSEIPDRWKDAVRRWARWNKRKKTKVDGDLSPASDDEYLLYQTLIGSWPVVPPKGPDLSAYVERVQAYMIKAIREAKIHSSWIAPDEAYEKALTEFIAAIVAEEPLTAFRTDFDPLVQDVTRWGLWNSLSQAVLRLTCPGLPDTYQGTELWDFSLVDPDNRRAVDYDHRRLLLETLRSAEDRLQFLTELTADPNNGRIKLWVTHQLLHLRHDAPSLLTTGDYIPLEVRGTHANRICAFARRADGQVAVVAVPRFTAGLGDASSPPIGAGVWQETQVILPGDLAGYRFRNVLTDGAVSPAGSGGALLAADLFNMIPAAVLVSNPIQS